MKWFRRVLATVSYVAVAGAPILAATGVGAPVAVALGAVGLAAGGALHFMDSPKSAADAAKLGTTVKGAIDAVKAIQK
jgi:hypothetical protein